MEAVDKRGESDDLFSTKLNVLIYAYNYELWREKMRNIVVLLGLCFSYRNDIQF